MILLFFCFWCIGRSIGGRENIGPTASSANRPSRPSTSSSQRSSFNRPRSSSMGARSSLGGRQSYLPTSCKKSLASHPVNSATKRSASRTRNNSSDVKRR